MNVDDSGLYVPKHYLLAANDRIADLECELAEAVALVRRASTDSLVTHSDDPGCFYCDSAGEHAASCPAAQILARHGAKP